MPGPLIYLGSTTLINFVVKGYGYLLMKTGYTPVVTTTVDLERENDTRYQEFKKTYGIQVIDDHGGFTGPNRGEYSIQRSATRGAAIDDASVQLRR